MDVVEEKNVDKTFLIAYTISFAVVVYISNVEFNLELLYNSKKIFK
jgi:hypothetical protein